MGEEPKDDSGDIAVPQELLCTGSSENEIVSPFLYGQCSNLSDLAIPTQRNEGDPDKYLPINTQIRDPMTESKVFIN